jgi:hypothetical protein
VLKVQYVGEIRYAPRSRHILISSGIARSMGICHAEMNLCLGAPQETASYLNNTSTQCQGTNTNVAKG